MDPVGLAAGPNESIGAGRAPPPFSKGTLGPKTTDVPRAGPGELDLGRQRDRRPRERLLRAGLAFVFNQMPLFGSLITRHSRSFSLFAPGPATGAKGLPLLLLLFACVPFKTASLQFTTGRRRLASGAAKSSLPAHWALAAS